MNFGFWVLDFGFWVLDFFFFNFGFWVLGFGFWVLGFGFWVLDFGFWGSGARPWRLEGVRVSRGLLNPVLNCKPLGGMEAGGPGGP